MKHLVHLAPGVLEKQIPIITYELPTLGINEMKKIHNPVLKDLMTGYYDHMLS